MFGFIKNKLVKIFNQFTSKIGALFGRSTIDADTLKELEIILLSADTGVETTRSVIEQLKKQTITHGHELKQALHTILLDILAKPTTVSADNIYLLVGINGTGKTTFAGKLAHQLVHSGKKTLLVAADTFRAAAPEQLAAWAQRTGADIITGDPEQDPAAVVFKGCEKFKQENYDALIIDTAGRLQTKKNLMNELAKIKRIIAKHLPEKHIQTLLTIDSMLGQNSFEQARLFKESTDVTGIVLTKMDGTGKGGIVFAITQELNIPIAYITFGEQVDQLKEFNIPEYVTELLGE